MSPDVNGIVFRGTLRCPVCRGEIAAPDLACVGCLKKTTTRHYLALQANYIPHVRNGRFMFSLVRGDAKERGTFYHLELFGVSSLAYCGADICRGCRRVEAKFPEVLGTVLCPECRRELEKVLAAVPVMEAV